MLSARPRPASRPADDARRVRRPREEHIIKLGYDVAYGARPLLRVIQNMVEDGLAEHLLLGKYEPGSTIIVDKDPEAGLDIRQAEPEPLTPVEAL
jgi:ATP-dependent Clp protease ATP-binding subunit ClpA